MTVSSQFQNQNNEDEDFGFITDEEYGFEPESTTIEEPIPKSENPKETPVEDSGFISDEEYGFEPDKETNEQKKEKAGVGKSVWLGAQEAILGPLSMVYGGVDKLVQAGEKGIDTVLNSLGYDHTFKELTPEQRNPLGAYVESFPESEDEAARRARVGTTAVISSLPFGVAGVVGGLVGSQAGQTVREVYGKEGKFDELGWGELGALTADLFAGGISGGLTAAAQGARRATQQVPSVFRHLENFIQRKSAKTAIQGNKARLQQVIDGFSTQLINEFEEEAARVSPREYTVLNQSNASALKRNADTLFRNAELDTITMLSPTPEQGGRAMQEAANLLFQQNVQGAERAAYTNAEQAARHLSGEAPQTLQLAQNLLHEITAVTPTNEQGPIATYLRTLIRDLTETTEPSRILNAQGNPVHPGGTGPRTRPVNELIDMVQNGNQVVNYESEFREQSHRLIPILDSLRSEVGGILQQDQAAQILYRQANDLHAANAQIWGTNYMRNVRFSENPENLIPLTKKASNMRNFKEAVPDHAMHGVAERLVIDNLTQSGEVETTRRALRNLSPELTVNARNAAEQLINVKDPLASTGGRAATRNSILTDAAKSVNTGKRPEYILDLMETPKGYALVREAMNGSPQSRELFQSFERLFVEDLFQSTMKNGQIDFGKAKEIFKNDNIRNVTRQIGGQQLVDRFERLERYANNFQANKDLYKSAEAQSFISKMVASSKNAGLIGMLMHAFHFPYPVIAAAGIGAAGLKTGKVGYQALDKMVFSNPRITHYLEALSRARTLPELQKQLPRLIVEIDKQQEKEESLKNPKNKSSNK